jgi:hypothetical protein
MMTPTSNARNQHQQHHIEPQRQPQHYEQTHYTQTSTGATPGGGGGQQQPLNRSISAVQSQLPGQPTQSRSFRILQMITDTASDPNGPSEIEAGLDQVDNGRLSRSSVGSNNSNGSGGQYRPSYQQQQSLASGVPPPSGERRLNLTHDDRQLMDMFRSQGKFELFLFL